MKHIRLFENFNDDFNKADKKVHPVETQWHFPIMAKYGFTPITKTGTGFVRSYDYENEAGYKMTVTTGVHADHWKDPKTGEGGYWAGLEPHLQKLAKTNEGHDGGAGPVGVDTKEAAITKLKKWIEDSKEDDGQFKKFRDVKWVGDTTEDKMDKLANQYEDQYIVAGTVDGVITFAFSTRS